MKKHGLCLSSVVTNKLPKSGSYATITTNNNVSIQLTPPLRINEEPDEFFTQNQREDVWLLCHTSLDPVPNAQVCVHLTVHITKL